MRELWIVIWCVLVTPCLAQFEYAQEQPANLGQAIGVGAERAYSDLQAKVRELESRSILDQIEAVNTDEFSPNDGSVLTHFVEEHQGARLLKKLHEYIHQRIEALRPEGVHAYVVMEATQDEYDTFMNGAIAQEMLRGNWVIVRQDKRPGNKVANFVVIGKTHYSHIGYMTREALQRIVDKATPRKSQPLKQAKWKISRVVMRTQPFCKPCDEWKRANLAAVKADGVDFVEMPPDGRNTPAFDVEVCNDAECRTLKVGNVSYATMKSTASSL